jgi:hypothetical protein
MVEPFSWPISCVDMVWLYISAGMAEEERQTFWGRLWIKTKQDPLVPIGELLEDSPCKAGICLMPSGLVERTSAHIGTARFSKNRCPGRTSSIHPDCDAISCLQDAPPPWDAYARGYTHSRLGR